jgi:hypothetical protein
MDREMDGLMDKWMGGWMEGGWIVILVCGWIDG